MELQKKQWFVRWFLWSCAFLDAFTDYRTDNRWKFEKGVDLCRFIRVTFVWTPLALLFNIGSLVLLVAALTWAPIVFWGVGAYAAVAIAIAAVVGIIWGITAYRDYKEKQRMLHPEEAREQAAPQKETAAAPKPPGFFAVLWSYAVAVKRKICPMLTFNAPAEGAAS